MDSHDQDHRLLGAFLAGDLDPAAARRWDAHLLECEQCWRAVREDRTGRQAAQLLRRPAPRGLADRVAFAVEVAAAGREYAVGQPSEQHRRAAGRRRARAPARSRWRARPGGRPRWQWLAVAGMSAVALVVTLMVLLLPAGRQTQNVPAAVAAVAHYARTVPPQGRAPDAHPDLRVVPVEVGRPVTVTAGGQQIVLRTWRVGGAEAVVAISGRPFPMPAGARGLSGMGMAWSARLGKLGLYCLNGRTSELVAAPVPATELAALATLLPLG